MTDSEKLKVVTVLELANMLADWVVQEFESSDVKNITGLEQ